METYLIWKREHCSLLAAMWSGFVETAGKVDFDLFCRKLYFSLTIKPEDTR